MTRTSVSVVIPSHNEGQQLRATVDSLLAGLPADGEIVVVDDGSTDASADRLARTGHPTVRVLRPADRLGAAGARNHGAICATGDVLVFCDAHVQAPPDWPDRLLPLLDQPGVGAAAPAVSVMDLTPTAIGYGFRWKDAALNVDWLGWQGSAPHPVPLLPGCFLGIRHDVFAQIGGFDNGLAVWGSEDGELCLRLWLLGYECWLVPTLEVAHLFRTTHPYRVDWEVVLHNLLRVGVVHFGQARLARMIANFNGSPAFASAFASLLDGDACARRAWLRAARLHDDDWFFSRFDMAW
jgi:GT2 family glycosyltransferase